MAFSDMMSNLGSSAMGMFTDGAGAKAVFYIPNPNIYIPEDDGSVGPGVVSAMNEIAQKFENTLVKESTGKGLKDSFKSVKDGAVDLGKTAKSLGFKGSAVAAGKSLGGALAPGQKSANKVGEVSDKDQNFFKIPVQFNPASMRMDSLNGKVKSMNSSGNNTAKLLNEQDYSGRTKLSFDLIFDDVNLMDAFMLQEVVDMNVTKALDKLGSMYTHGGNFFSVRARMETFLSLLVSPLTQHVIFHWGKMVFRGQVTGVNNQYTMFNTSGNPIRGTMHLDITQDDRKEGKKKQSEQGDNYSYQNMQWKQSFDKTFVNGKGGGTSTLSALTNNNILNF